MNVYAVENFNPSKPQFANVRFEYLVNGSLHQSEFCAENINDKFYTDVLAMAYSYFKSAQDRYINVTRRKIHISQYVKGLPIIDGEVKFDYGLATVTFWELDEKLMIKG